MKVRPGLVITQMNDDHNIQFIYYTLVEMNEKTKPHKTPPHINIIFYSPQPKHEKKG